MTEPLLMEPEIDRRPSARPTARHRGSGLSQLLRRIIGVQEDVLDWVPEDRAKLTRTGAIVACTAMFAGVSAWIILHEFLAADWAVALAGALFWASVIGVFDAWLISTTHGVVDRTRFWILMPRLLVAGVIGVIVSEPLTLKVFESAIVEQIATDNQAKIREVERTYSSCYPYPAKGADCSGVKLNVAAPDAGTLTKLKAERDALAKTLKPLNRRRDKLARKVTEECAGIKGNQVSGIPGEGPRCKIRRDELVTYEQTHNLVAQNVTLNALNEHVKTLIEKNRTRVEDFEKDAMEQINAKITEERAKFAATPGLLERFEGLGALTDRSWTVWWAHLMLAVLLILIDCFPVLTKLISKPSAYDRRIAVQIESKERRHDNDLRLTERLHTGDNDVRLHREEARIRQAMEESDYKGRLEAARREAELRERIDHLIAQVKNARR